MPIRGSANPVIATLFSFSASLSLQTSPSTAVFELNFEIFRYVDECSAVAFENIETNEEGSGTGMVLSLRHVLLQITSSRKWLWLRLWLQVRPQCQIQFSVRFVRQNLELLN
eukprot:436872_1